MGKKVATTGNNANVGASSDLREDYALDDKLRKTQYYKNLIKFYDELDDA